MNLLIEKTLESPLVSKMIKSVNPKGNQPLNIHWKGWSWSSNTLATWCEEPAHWKDPDAGKDWRQEEKGTTEHKKVGWDHQLNGQEFEQALGVGGGWGGQVCCSPWGRKETRLTDWTTLPLQEDKIFEGGVLFCSTDGPQEPRREPDIQRINKSLLNKEMNLSD